MKTKTEFVGFKVSGKEKAQIQKEAERKGLGVSAWIRFLVFDNRNMTLDARRQSR